MSEPTTYRRRHELQPEDDMQRPQPHVSREDFQALVAENMHMASFRVKLREMAKHSGLGYRTIAHRMQTSLSSVERIVAGKNVTLDTLMHFVWACGHRLILDVRKR